MRPIHLLTFAAAAVFFTSSFDIFLNLNVGPNVRIAQVFAIVLIVAALLTRRLGLAMDVPLGAPWLIAWWCMQLAFVPAAEFWQKSLAYCVWLALNIALSFALVNLFARDWTRMQILLRLYLFSYVFVAAFGIVQFALPVAGGPALLVEQWWLPGSVPRVNGFSFEPSYFATYLLLGLVCLGSLRRSGLAQFGTRRWTLAYLLLIVAMILCSSRIGIFFVLLELAIAPIRWMWRVAKNPRLILGFRVSILKTCAAAAVVALGYVAASEAIGWFRDNPQTLQILVSGTGLMGTAAHSVNEREERLNGTMLTIANHPWMGQSLGGITESIAGSIGVKPMNFEESKVFEGQSVFAEVVAASGWPGSIPFLCFLVVSIVSPLRLAGRAPPLHAAWLRALVVSLLFEWAILQFNQNILRLYLWVHIAVLAAVDAAVRRQYGEPSGGPAGGYD
jgi:hypothetical protein